ncbi:MAG: IS110 family transposase [Aquabacterium sp.]|jgi:transposase|uniref:IS110 family transposase n=1 Tax=Aquabacterium sp. TaxID=1872578 RepID=UPI002A359F99|nr:IS110 family transposase [Aquabacterium sp.]MDX9842646.1 IS110 family transposase [Aquabacterium sp.]
MAIIAVGIDLAKNVFAVHGVNAGGKAVLVRPTVKRDALLELVAKLPPCLIGMEACSGAHYWAREFAKFGRDVRIIAAKFVAAYRLSGRRGKNDAADAQAICEAVQRPHMRFVPVKSDDAQARLAIHRVRQGFVEQRMATINRIRGLLSEVHRLDERCRRLMGMPGIGEKTATALMASIGNGHDFKCGRQLAAWLGLVPGQYSSGGKQRLGRITKAGDSYLRMLLILGARSVVVAAKKKTDRLSRWVTELVNRRGYWKAVVAVAAKNARMAWAMLSKGEAFEPIG